MKNDDWKNPEHYKKKKWEAIDIIKDVLTPEQFEGYLIGNSTKQRARYTSSFFESI